MMLSEIPNENAGSLTAAEKVAVTQQLERILENRHFNHSRRFPAFLRFVVQKTLSGSTDLLKERTLGVEIFGRAADYDTSSDPIVRVTAAEIRKRIAQYYQEPGHETELRISVDAGSYVPQFHWPHQPSAALVEQYLEGLKRPSGEIAAASPVESSQPRSVFRPALMFSIVLAVVALSSFFVWRTAHASPIDFFWGPVINSTDPAIFCIVEQRLFSGVAVDANDPSRQILNKTDMYSVNLDDATAIVKIGGVLHGGGKKYTFHAADTTTLSDIRNGPTIFVGAFDNPWTMRLTKPLHFRFGNDPGFTQEWIYDSSSSKPPQWFTQRPAQESSNNYREYGLIARYTNPDTGQLCIVVAGIGQASTRAAGEFLTDPAELAALERLAPRDGRKNVEVVISTQIIDGQAGSPKIEATYFW
jgi:hypothetical protein